VTAEPRALDGKAALVTGAAAGIGRATAERLARAGAAVAVFDRDGAGAARVVEAIGAAGGRALAVTGDVAVAADVARAVAETVAAFGGLHVLVNNAGIVRRATVVETTEEEWDRVMAVNVKSVFLAGKAAVPVMAAAGGGAIVNIASGWGLVGGRRATTRPTASAWCACARATPTPACCARRRGSSASRRRRSWPTPRAARSAASGPRRTSRRPCCTWRATPRASSPARCSSSTAAGWRADNG
jgi:NAD(P)-dependent dehydrogenase (short-subunit alcohol dehydrogenase family)